MPRCFLDPIVTAAAPLLVCVLAFARKNTGTWRSGGPPKYRTNNSRQTTGNIAREHEPPCTRDSNHGTQSTIKHRAIRNILPVQYNRNTLYRESFLNMSVGFASYSLLASSCGPCKTGKDLRRSLTSMTWPRGMLRSTPGPH